tara:strand:+ start:86 stop:763 length:678 start_codon:yes stop_codon:yes gene_type:complete
MTAKQKSVNQKILISGCGVSYGKNEIPTWVKVLKICGLDIKDLTGPGITNSLILNLLVDELHKNNYTHVICQLTNQKKLDVELNDNNKVLMQQDSSRNYTFQNYWPSSISTDHESKKMYYDYLYSPGIEEKDLIIKLLYLQELCIKQSIKLFIFEGMKIKWKDPLHKKIKIYKDFVMLEDYKKSVHYAHNEKTVTPNKFYQIEFAKKMNDIFLKQNIKDKLQRFL